MTDEINNVEADLKSVDSEIKAKDIKINIPTEHYVLSDALRRVETIEIRYKKLRICMIWITAALTAFPLGSIRIYRVLNLFVLFCPLILSLFEWHVLLLRPSYFNG